MTSGSSIENLAVGDIIDERFCIQADKISGGMSWVYQVIEVHRRNQYALKIMRPDKSTADAELAFKREWKALNSLSHPNIIKLEYAGTFLDTPYLVLEWLPNDLSRKIQASKPMSWVEFYEQIGRPILDALRHAHTRRVAHRDLKPQNILFDEHGTPKIADFGIARLTEAPQLGHTFSQAGSPPYTPPEHDDGYQSEQRDVFSWAAIALSCFCGRMFSNLGEVHSTLKSFSQSELPKEAFEAALSIEPGKRQQNASVLLADMDAFHQKCLDQAEPPITAYLKWSETSERNCKNILQHLGDIEAINQHIQVDLIGVCGADIEETDGVLRHITFIGATLRLLCSLEHYQKDRFIIEDIHVHAPSRAQEMREELTALKNATFTFKAPGFNINPVKIANALITRLRVSDAERARKQDEKRKNRWFDCWNAFLREKEQLYKKRQIRLKATRIEEDGDQYIATIEGDFNPEDIGESLVIQPGSKRPLIFEVTEVNVDKIFLTLLTRNAVPVPKGNVYLETNFEAERKAIARQRTALEEIRRDRAVSPSLKSILSDPSSAVEPEVSGFPLPTNLSPDKREILDAALGIQSILAVKGPPGTGKTTLIAELIVSYLKKYPKKRILLASQTHVALDHVIVKLKDQGLSDKIVRVISNSVNSAKKINDAVQELTLPRKTRKWCETVESRAKLFLDGYTKDKNVDATELKVYLVGQSLVSAKKRREEAEEKIKALREQENQIDQRRKQALDDGISPDRDAILSETSNIVDQTVTLKEEIANEQQRINRLEIQLKALGQFGNEIATSDQSTAEKWLEALDSSTEEGLHIKELTKLQLEWFDRLGAERSFHPAVLSDASVVAGTCIGLASTSAIYQDEYDLCIIDEASKATATETLVPMARSRTTMLVGDPEQLPPFFEDKKLFEIDGFSEDDTKKTLLSLMLAELPPANKKLLKEQRRMVFTIGEMVSQIFYQGDLENVRMDDERGKVTKFVFPKPITWISTKKMPALEKEHKGKTFSNPTEVEIVVAKLKAIAQAKTKSKLNDELSIAVIAAYSAQVKALREAIHQAGQVLAPLNIEVNTVDAFQGKEADICIYSITRNNTKKNLGFQREKPRLNVALSRARDALVIVGNDEFCASVKKDNPFLPVLDHINNNIDFCGMIYYERN